MMHPKPSLPILLLITDQPAIVHWMRKNLEGRHLLLEATKEANVVETVQSTSLDFIILDSALEESDPLALSRKIRQLNAIVPILLLTGRLKKAFRDEALDAGVTDFLNDQLDLEELETRIATGKKVASEREKAANLSEMIQSPKEKQSSRSYFKSKILLNDKALSLLAEAKKSQQPIALLTLRLDHFQQLEADVGMINAETLQHTLSEKIEALLNPGDLLIPYSNGRFILLLPQTRLDAARTKAEKLRNQIQQESFSIEEKKIHLTISIVISLPNFEEEKYPLIAASAMKALQQTESMTNLILSLDKETP